MVASLPPPPPRPGSAPGPARSSLPPPPPPPARATRWGLGDVFLGIAFWLGVSVVVSFAVAFVIAATEGLGEGSAGDILSDHPSLIVLPTLAQQLAMIVWVVAVARRKGRGVAADFGWRFRWLDLAIGLATAVAALVVSGVVMTALSAWSGTESVDNTAFVEPDDQGLWIIGVILMVVVGAPIAEELFFRGLLFRATEKKWSTAVAIPVSTVAFALVHFQPGTLVENLILFAGIGIYGLALAVVTAQFRRLGPAVVAHMLINGLVITVVLAGGA